MSRCKSILDYFKFNSESEILDGPENHDQSEPSVSGLPVLVYPASPNLSRMIQILIGN